MAAVSDSDRMVTSYFVNIFILTVSFGALPQSSGGQADLGSRGSPCSQVRGASHLQEHWARWGRPAWPATQESSEWSLIENCFAQEKSRRDDGLHVEQVRMVSLLKDPAEW